MADSVTSMLEIAYDDNKKTVFVIQAHQKVRSMPENYENLLLLLLFLKKKQIYTNRIHSWRKCLDLYVTVKLLYVDQSPKWT